MSMDPRALPNVVTTVQSTLSLETPSSRHAVVPSRLTEERSDGDSLASGLARSQRARPHPSESHA